MAGVIVADASVLIAHLDRTDVHHDGAVTLLLRAGGLPLAASPITVAEVLVAPARISRLDEAHVALRTLDLQEIALTPDAVPRLARLRADTNLKLPDCCVLLAAQDAPAQAILTFDERLASAARSLGLSTHSEAERW